MIVKYESVLESPSNTDLNLYISTDEMTFMVREGSISGKSFKVMIVIFGIYLERRMLCLNQHILVILPW
jgi:hypothetical protein